MLSVMTQSGTLDRIRLVVPKIEKILNVTGTPGLSFGIIYQGVTLPVGNLGLRDVEKGLAPDEQTRYSINSMTKGAIAALVGMEVARGTFDWNTRVKSVLPDFTSSDSIVENQATVLDLLSHRTGITNFDAPWLQSQNTILLNRDQIIPTFATLKVAQSFRTSFLYNNWGYELIGLILEKVTGTSLSDLLSTRLFQPLGMHRTSTIWQPEDDNIAKSYAVLSNLSPVEICKPKMGKDTLMEAAGGIKSTIEDLLQFYATYLRAINVQFASCANDERYSILKRCRTIVSNHALLPGPSLREQGYAAGWARSQLPGQLGRISQNVMLFEEPIVGKSGDSKLVLYHHGSMPGSTSCVHLIPETESAVVILQNSLAPSDTADLVGQMLVETLLDTPEPNDYVALAREANDRGLRHMSDVGWQLERNRKIGTQPRPLHMYAGTYWNTARNFRIDVTHHSGALQMQFQSREDEKYSVNHYQDDTFCWWMKYDDAARRGRYINDFGPEYYLIGFFVGDGQSEFNALRWAWDPIMPLDPEIFTRYD